MKYIAYFGLHFLALWPRWLSQAVGRWIGIVNYRLDTRSAKVSRVNVGLCFPELGDEESEELIRDSLRHTGQTAMETPAVWLRSSARIDSWIESVEGESLLTESLGRQGVIILLPHIGNWELFNVYIRRHGAMTALYQPPRQPYLRPLMAEIRSRHGNELVSPDKTGLARLYRCLKEGGVVTVLPDQVPGSGLYSPFFGNAVLTDQLIPRLARRTGAIVVTVMMERRPDGRFRVKCCSPDTGIYSEDPVTAVRGLNSTIEHCVRLVPTQYQWEYKRFRERPPGERKVYRFNKPVGYH